MLCLCPESWLPDFSLILAHLWIWSFEWTISCYWLLPATDIDTDLPLDFIYLVWISLQLWPSPEPRSSSFLYPAGWSSVRGSVFHDSVFVYVYWLSIKFLFNKSLLLGHLPTKSWHHTQASMDPICLVVKLQGANIDLSWGAGWCHGFSRVWNLGPILAAAVWATIYHCHRLPILTPWTLNQQSWGLLLWAP